MKAECTKSDLILATLLQKKRKDLGLSQRDVAAMLELKSNQPVFVSLIENGNCKLPPRLAPKYASILGISLKRVTNLLVAASGEVVRREIAEGIK